MSDVLREALEKIATGSPKLYGFASIDVAREALASTPKPVEPGVLLDPTGIGAWRSAYGQLMSIAHRNGWTKELDAKDQSYKARAKQLLTENQRLEFTLAATKAELVHLQGGEQETMSDHKRARLFKGSGVDYIRHRALKHETKYHDLAQAQHLRQLATDIEVRLGAAKAEAEGLRVILPDLIAEAEEAANYAEVYRQGSPRFDEENKRRRELIDKARGLIRAKGENDGH